MIPYLTMLILCGIPLLYLEMAVGQYTGFGPVRSFAILCPLMKGEERLMWLVDWRQVPKAQGWTCGGPRGSLCVEALSTLFRHKASCLSEGFLVVCIEILASLNFFFVFSLATRDVHFCPNSAFVLLVADFGQWRQKKLQ